MPRRPKTVNEYMAALRGDQRVALQKLRKAIKSVAPKAEEYIGYGVPSFRLDGKRLVCIKAAANHCAFHPMSSSTVKEHQAELKGYSTSPGTIRFQPDHPLPAALVRKLVKARIAENRRRKNKE